ncbi:non-ribosomal peptide synthetase [Priestia megaterium]|uniref:non-ribosomal peptide synthetase n=1 Tax=Priestia megaterium TaxID=1404 RepID=UPI002E22C312|nr:non-ribosomal peptide synthetase [Priestia megaterium]
MREGNAISTLERKRGTISTLEVDTTAQSQVFISHHTNSSMIGNIISKLENVSTDVNLYDVIYPCIEYTSSQTEHEDFIERESSRPIGASRKIRMVFAIANNYEADLIIVANQEFVSFQDVLHAYKFIIGESSELLLNNNKKYKYASYRHPNWGIPVWDNKTVFSHSYKFNISDLNSKYNSNIIASALLITLAKYGSRNCNILIEENDFETKKIRTGTFEDGKSINISDEIVNNDDLLTDFDAGIIINDLTDINCKYSPCLTSLFPVTICVTTNNNALQSINVSASEKFVHPVVLEQFVDLFNVHLKYITENVDFSVTDLLSMSITEELHENSISQKINQIPRENSNFDLLETLNSVARSYPNQLAVSDSNNSITYSELNRRSDFIAKKLLSHGINEGVNVVVSLDQTVELILVLVSIVKAGGTYIPVDPNYPIERISFVIDDSSATFVITDLPEVHSMNNINVISSTNLFNDDNNMSLESISLPIHAPSNAYVIYTSGTSGQPKGVLVSSKNIVSLVDATKHEFKLTEKDVWTMFHSASFDFSIWEMWGCLLTGAHLVVVPRQTARSPYDFYDLMIKKNVTILNQTPSAFYALQKVDAEQKSASLSSLRLVIFGGEALDTYKISNWLKRYPVGCCRLVNMYGITETTVHVTYRNILHKDPEFLSKSVGVALPGWEISIRDTSGVPCLYGIEGEIWVGGVGLSNGYLNREKLTNERFVIDPKDGQRWYRSGDLGRMRPDGSIDYLGRIDNQVKLRGFRIELDEIRSVIQKAPYVNDVAIVLHDGDDVQSSQKQIIAFIESFEQVNPDKIRKYLKSKVPEYMIPARIINVNEIPITINGKVDYKSLMLKANNPEQEFPGEANNSKDSYLSIWRKVLGHAIEPEDNFFESGGNSLLAVELLSALKKEVNDSLTLRDIYINSSPKALEEFLSKK